MAGKILEAELRITGKDGTGAAFAGVMKRAQELKTTIAGMQGMRIGGQDFAEAEAAVKRVTAALRTERTAAQEVARSITVANEALGRHAGMMQRIRDGFRGMSGLGYLAGPALLYGTKTAVHSGADIQSEKVKMRAAGIPESEITSASRQAYGLQSQFPNVGVGSILERYKELRSVILHPEETPELLPALVRAQSAMRAIDKSGHLGESLIFAVKAAEVMGLAQDPKRFTSYLDSFIRAQQVMGKTITPEQQFDLATNFKASAATLSDRFKSTTGISLAQELRGMRAGVGVDQFVKQIVGGFQGNQHSAAKEFVALGLAKKDDFDLTKTGEIKGFKHGRHVLGSELAASDPDLWVYKYLMPALQKAGYKTQQDQINEVRRLFTSSRSADIVAKLIQQEQSFKNHAKLYEQAQGLNATDNNANDPFAALGSLTESLKTFAGTLASPMMEVAAQAMTNLAHRAAALAEGLSEWQKRNPQLAEMMATGTVVGGGGVAVGLTYGLLRGVFSGFGLKGSAAALSGSAAALDAVVGSHRPGADRGRRPHRRGPQPALDARRSRLADAGRDAAADEIHARVLARSHQRGHRAAGARFLVLPARMAVDVAALARPLPQP